MSGYIGINGKARNIVNGYIGIDGKARNIIKCYIGDENGKAKLLLSFDKWDGTTLKTINGSNVSNYNINRGNIVLINGKVEKRLNKIQIIANKIERM